MMAYKLKTEKKQTADMLIFGAACHNHEMSDCIEI